MADTAIEWADRVWNPTTGCDRVSPGCDRCYAMTMAKRLKGMGQAKYQRDGNPRTSGPGFGLSVHPASLEIPLRWRKPQRIFVNSMSDLFHDQVPDDYIAWVFATMAVAQQHTFQVLTKRHARMRSLLKSGEFQTAVAEHILELTPEDQLPDAGDPFPLPNLWLGVSAENQQWADIRIPALLDTPAAVRFVSAEPLLGPIDLLGDEENPGPAVVRTGWHNPSVPWGPGEYGYDDQLGIDWVIVGGESGHGARPMHPEWARSLRDQCQAAGVAYLFKQWGEWRPATMSDHPKDRVGGMVRVGKKAAGRQLDGRTWDEYPQAVSHA